jgi:DNA-binding response OmpR family regulator
MNTIFPWPGPQRLAEMQMDKPTGLFEATVGMSDDDIYQEAPYTILVIDDDESFRELVRHFLVKAGYDVLEAADGAEGICLVRQATVHLMITDMIMPDHEGVETILRARTLYPSLKILAMSGVSARHSYLRLAARVGADATLDKAHVPQHLLNSVRSLLNT